ncbi:hypothetical protein [Amphritea japonica]|uniref:hypothetical protein n=1 Tax=Amphritea japonica TaxID=452627 RepID=UPI001916558A|nr:hypothetical protein [Amphritea japonica]
MIKVCYYLEGYYNNIIFDLSDKGINRDDYAYSHYLLKLNAEEKGVSIATLDINSRENSDYIIYHDVCDDELVSEPSKVKKMADFV